MLGPPLAGVLVEAAGNQGPALQVISLSKYSSWNISQLETNDQHSRFTFWQQKFCLENILVGKYSMGKIFCGENILAGNQGPALQMIVHLWFALFAVWAIEIDMECKNYILPSALWSRSLHCCRWLFTGLQVPHTLNAPQLFAFLHFHPLC